jgi:hypothetical protein
MVSFGIWNDANDASRSCSSTIRVGKSDQLLVQFVDTVGEG